MDTVKLTIITVHVEGGGRIAWVLGIHPLLLKYHMNMSASVQTRTVLSANHVPRNSRYDPATYFTKAKIKNCAFFEDFQSYIKINAFLWLSVLENE